MTHLRKNLKWTPEKIAELKELLLSGKTLEDCGEKYGVTRERIRQLKKKHMKLSKTEWGKAKSRPDRVLQKIEERERLSATWRTTGRESHKWHDAVAENKYRTYLRKKHNLKRGSKLEMSATFLEIPHNDICPVLGIPINWDEGRSRTDNSPSYDRVDNRKGYETGNVQVISWRANRIKSDGTSEEHLKIYQWMKNQGL